MQLTANFSLHEFACNDSENTPVTDELIANIKNLAEQLQVIRDAIGAPLHINSAYRTPAHNKAVGGKPNSYHMKGMAADIATRYLTPKQLAKVVEKLITDKKIKIGGVGVYASFIHVDTRTTKARW